MNANTKRVIKGVAKTTGRYTLKGLGKGVELASRGALKTVDALIRNPQIQTLATAAGILAASVMIPSVGVGVVSMIGLKYLVDSSLENNKGLLGEIGDMLRAGNVVTRNVSNKILSPTLNTMDRGMKTLGRKYQDKVDNMLR